MENLTLIKPEKVQNIINKFCYTIGMIPTSYKMSLTYEEQILAIGHYLEETVIPALNNNAEAVAELQSLFIQLKDYVENYFDNLDVQKEINNKLDTMAASGELQEIIISYLNINGLLCFNTLNDLKNAVNLINGSFVKTYGLNLYNDGLGYFYKIRNITNTDVIDDITIIALNDENLVAELIPTHIINVKYFGAKGDGETDDIDAIKNAISYAKEKNIFNVYIPTGTYIVSNQIKMFSNLNLFGDGENTIIKALNFSNQNDYKSMIVLENMPMNDNGNNVKNISIKNIKLDNNGLAYAGHDGLIQFRGVRNAIIENIYEIVNGENCWGIILFSANHNVKIDNVKIDNTSNDNSLGGCLWVRSGLSATTEDTKTKNIFVTNSSFTSTAKDELVVVADGVDGGWTECEINNITLEGKAINTLPNYLLILNTVTENGYIKVDIDNINIKGNCSSYAILCSAYNSDKIDFTANNLNITMNLGGGIYGGYLHNKAFNNCNIKISQAEKRACLGALLSNSYANATCEGCQIKNCFIDSGDSNCCEDCSNISDSILKTSGKGIHSYGNQKFMIVNNEIYADVNAIHLQNNGNQGAHDTLIMGNYMQRLNNTDNSGSIAINVPYIRDSRSFANRYLLKTGSSTGTSYGYNYYDNSSNSSNYINTDDQTTV